jgi:hypothetical protein
LDGREEGGPIDVFQYDFTDCLGYVAHSENPVGLVASEEIKLLGMVLKTQISEVRVI